MKTFWQASDLILTLNVLFPACIELEGEVRYGSRWRLMKSGVVSFTPYHACCGIDSVRVRNRHQRGKLSVIDRNAKFRAKQTPLILWNGIILWARARCETQWLCFGLGELQDRIL